MMFLNWEWEKIWQDKIFLSISYSQTQVNQSFDRNKYKVVSNEYKNDGLSSKRT